MAEDSRGASGMAVVAGGENPVSFLATQTQLLMSVRLVRGII